MRLLSTDVAPQAKNLARNLTLWPYNAKEPHGFFTRQGRRLRASLREMSNHTKTSGRSRSQQGRPRRRRKPARDLIDFYSRWSEFRQIAVAISQRADLSA